MQIHIKLWIYKRILSTMEMWNYSHNWMTQYQLWVPETTRPAASSSPETSASSAPPRPPDARLPSTAGWSPAATRSRRWGPFRRRGNPGGSPRAGTCRRRQKRRRRSRKKWWPAAWPDRRRRTEPSDAGSGLPPGVHSVELSGDWAPPWRHKQTLAL